MSGPSVTPTDRPPVVPTESLPDRDRWDSYSIMSSSQFTWELENLLGKVLTIMDSSIRDDRQNKAVKDLLRAEFHTRTQSISDRAWKPFAALDAGEVPNAAIADNQA